MQPATKSFTSICIRGGLKLPRIVRHHRDTEESLVQPLALGTALSCHTRIPAAKSCHTSTAAELTLIREKHPSEGLSLRAAVHTS